MENTITIQTVKEIVNENNELIGYLVDGTKSVPLAEGNRDYREIKEYIANGGVVEPGFTEEELVKQELQIKIQEAKQYLAKTDYKFFNGYKPKVEEDLVEIERLRDEAREFIRANEGDE